MSSELTIDCSLCEGQGWTTEAHPYTGEATQVQCENCYGTGKLSSEYTGEKNDKS